MEVEEAWSDELLAYYSNTCRHTLRNMIDTTGRHSEAKQTSGDEL